MESSERTLGQKLVEAQSEMEHPKLDKVNPHYKSRYASLGALIAVIEPPLLKHGIRLSQPLVADEESNAAVQTVVSDGNDTMVLGYFPLPNLTDPQKMGSAITYARRYSLSCAFSRVAEEDDDGNAAAGQAPEPKAKPEPKPRARSHDWDEIRDLITKAKRCGLTDEELTQWMNQTFEGRDKKTFGETERNIITLWLKSYIKEGKHEQG